MASLISRETQQTRIQTKSDGTADPDITSVDKTINPVNRNASLAPVLLAAANSVGAPNVRDANMYRPGDGTDRGNLRYVRRNEDGTHTIESKTTEYTVPAKYQSRDEVRAWTMAQVKGGGITTPLFGAPAPAAPATQETPAGTMYRPGDGIGTSKGNLVYDGQDAQGRHVVRSRTTRYTAPPEVQTREQIHKWANDAVNSGAITTGFYQGEPAKAGQTPATATATGKRLADDIAGKAARGLMTNADKVALAKAAADLPVAERRNLVNELAGRPAADPKYGTALNQWVASMTTNGVGPFGPLSDTDTRTFQNNVVKGQDGKGLARLAEAFSKTGTDRASEFARSIAASASDTAKASYLKLTAGGLNSQAKSLEASIITASIKDPKLIDDLFATNGKRWIANVVASGATPHLPGYDRSQVLDHGVSNFQSLASTIAKSNSVTTKSAFVAAAGQLLDEVKGKDALAKLTASVSKVIATDVTGIIETTLQQRDVSNGHTSLKKYARALITTGNTGDLNSILHALRAGNDLKADPGEYLGRRESRAGGMPDYQNARRLGEFIGVLGGAVNGSNTDRTDLSVLGSIFAGTALGVAFANPVVGVGVGFLNAAAYKFREDINRSEQAFVNALLYEVMPRSRSGGFVNEPWRTTLDAAVGGSLRR